MFKRCKTVIVVALVPLLAGIASAFSTRPLVFTKRRPSSHSRPLLVSNSLDEDIPALITTPTLKQAYPHMVQYKAKYGNPNIPLGSKEGRLCQSLRRLRFKGLTEQEVELLDEMGFLFESLEDLYRRADFDDLFQRMMDYEATHQTKFQIPKKCPEDPELGAWVTGIRRLGPEGVDPEHKKRLMSVDFAWKSTRKCGSKFMEQYRAIQAQLSADDGSVWEDNANQKWVRAQQEANRRGTLSETRRHYMEGILGEEWMEKEFDS